MRRTLLSAVARDAHCPCPFPFSWAAISFWLVCWRSAASRYLGAYPASNLLVAYAQQLRLELGRTGCTRDRFVPVHLTR